MAGVRRDSSQAPFPYLSVGLAAVLLLVFLVIQLGFQAERRALDLAAQEAVEYAIHNPVVEVGPRVMPIVRAVVPGFDGNETFEVLRRKGRGSAEQVHFDDLTQQILEGLDAQPYRRFGVVPARLWAPSLATHVLLHTGWLHLLGALLLLLLVGSLLEATWGRSVTALLMIGSGLSGAGAFALAHASTERALVGASAVVAGVVAAALMRFRSERVVLLDWLPGVADAGLRLPGWLLGIPWLGYAALLWWALPGALPGGVDNAVGYSAQAAGAVFGVLLAIAAARIGVESRLRRSLPVASQSSESARFDFRKILEARAQGESDRAWAMLRAEVGRSARNRDAVTTYWEMAIERRTPEEAGPAMLQLLREELRRGGEDAAITHWGELIQHLPSLLPDPASLARLIPVIERIEGKKRAMLALKQAVSDENGPLSSALALRLANLAAPLAPGIAVATARRALGNRTLSDAQREELTALLAFLVTEQEQAAEDEEKPPSSGDVFYQESDRSEFGDAQDLNSLSLSFPDGAVSEAVPRGIGAKGMEIEKPDGRTFTLPWSRLRALAVVGVHGVGPKPVLLVDLLVDGSGTERPLSVIRFRSDRYDPRRLVEAASDPLDALRKIVAQVLERARVQPLPHDEAVRLAPVCMYGSLAEYHDNVLRRAGEDWL
jgi:membrane associated rhomboid family serine protease